MKTDRCTTLRLDLRDLARAAEDPKLAALLSEKWTVIAHIAVAEDDGAPGLVLILAPPGEVAAAIVRAPTQWSERLPFLLVFAGWAATLGAWVLARFNP